MSKITDKISQIDTQYALAPNPQLYNRRLQLQTEFDILSTRKPESLLLKFRQRVFEFVEKASRLLAQQTCSAAASRLNH